MKLAEILIFVEHYRSPEERIDSKHALLPSELDAQHPIINLLSDNDIQIVNSEVEYRMDSKFEFCSMVVAQDPTARHEGKIPVYENHFGKNSDILSVLSPDLRWSFAGVLHLEDHEVINPMNSVVHIYKLLASGVFINPVLDKCPDHFKLSHGLLGASKVPNLDSKSGCLLYYSIFRGYTPLCEALLRSELSESEGFSFRKYHLKIAFSSGNVQVVEAFKKAGIDICKYIKSIKYALHSAVESGLLDVVKFLLDNGVDVNQRGPTDKSALHSCCNLAVGQYMLSRGADVDFENRLHMTPLYNAVNRGDSAFVKLLLSHRANPNASFNIDRRISKDVKCSCAGQAVHEGFKNISAILARFGARSRIEILLGDVFGRRSRCPFFHQLEVLPTEAQNLFFEDVQVYLDHNFSNFPTPYHPIGPEQVTLHEIFLQSQTRLNIGKRRVNNKRTVIMYKDYVPVLAKHIIKIEAAYGSTAPEEIRVLRADLQLDGFERDCKKEVAVMSRECIPHTSVSFFDILTGNVDDLSRLFRNENAVESLKVMDIQARFPLYSGVLRCRISDGLWKKRIQDDAMKLFSFLFAPHFTSILQELKECIVGMLSNQDVLVLEACFNDYQLKAIVGYPNCLALLESPFL